MGACFQLALDHLSDDARGLLALVSRRPNGCRYDDLLGWWSRDVPLSRAVGELVEAGFAATTTDVAGAARLTQIPVIRAFGCAQRVLDADAAADGALDQAVLGRAQGWAMAARSLDVEPDLPDIRRMLQRGLEDGPDADAAADAACQLAVMLTVYWWSMRLTEGRQWLEALLARTAGRPSPIRPYAIQTAAFLDFYVGDAETARNRLDDALGGDVPDPAAHARLLALRAMFDAAQNQHETAGRRVQEAVSLARGADDLQSLFFALGNAGDVATAGGDTDQARECYLECIERLRRGGMDWISAAPHARLGDLDLSAGEHRRARMWFERSIALWSSRELGPGAPQTLAGLARLDVVEGDHDAARRRLDAALATAEQCGSRGEYPWVVLGYAALLAAQGRQEDAAVLFELGLRHGQRAGHSVSRLIDAELEALYRGAMTDQDSTRLDPVVLTTSLEDLPAVLGAMLATPVG